MDKQRSEHERFADLIRTQGRSMFRVARAILDSDTDAEDAVGEAILRAWQSFGELRKPECAKSWVLKITVNCARSQRRKQSRVIYLDDMEQAAGAAGEAEPSGLWDTVRRLPEAQRTVVLLYYYEEMSVAEIAHTLGLPQGTVKSRLSRGREKLRELLREEERNGCQP